MKTNEKTLLSTSILLLESTLGGMSPSDADSIVSAVVDILKTIK